MSLTAASQAVLRALELEAYRALPRPAPGWIVARLGITRAEEQRALELLVATGQATEASSGYSALGERRMIDTR